MVVKVIAIATSIQAAKAQDEEEEGEEGDAGAFSFMVSVYTVLIILLTILAQGIWKVAVERSRAPEGSSSTDFRSLPVSAEEEEEEEKDDEEQEIQALQQRAKMRAEERKTRKIGAEVLTVGPGTGGNPVLRVGPGTGGNQPRYPGEEGLGQKGSVQLPGRLLEIPRPSVEETANATSWPYRGSSGSDQVGPSRGSWAERGDQSESPLHRII